MRKTPPTKLEKSRLEQTVKQIERSCVLNKGFVPGRFKVLDETATWIRAVVKHKTLLLRDQDYLHRKKPKKMAIVIAIHGIRSYVMFDDTISWILA